MLILEKRKACLFFLCDRSEEFIGFTQINAWKSCQRSCVFRCSVNIRSACVGGRNSCVLEAEWDVSTCLNKPACVSKWSLTDMDTHTDTHAHAHKHTCLTHKHLLNQTSNWPDAQMNLFTRSGFTLTVFPCLISLWLVFVLKGLSHIPPAPNPTQTFTRF